jgi:hypothetical protein
MPPIRSQAELYEIGSWTLLRLPETASAKLPSRGMVMIDGTINGFGFQAALEPDGKGSHWLRIDKAMRQGAAAGAGDTVTLEIEPVSEWPEPKVPADLQDALSADPKARAVWTATTPIARWDWIRWIRATSQAETRARRIDVACSKLRSGQRRPCCFNRSACTEPSVSRNGVLIEPS